MNNKQVIVDGVLESTNDLRSVFVEHIHFKKLMKFWKLLKYFTGAWPAQEKEIRFLLIIFIDKNDFKKVKSGAI